MAVPLGHRNPRLKTSSRSPRTSVISRPSRWSSRPHVASQNGHVRYSTRLPFAVILARVGPRARLRSGLVRALVFGVDPGFTPPEQSFDDGNLEGRLLHGLATTPMALQDVPDAGLLGDDWVVLRSRLTGICGSDTKQVFMDMGDGDASDFSMTAFISFPQVLGHEVVADV